MDAESGSGTNGEPEASGRCAIGGLVAIDQPKARLAFVRLNVEADSSTVGQLGMATGSHQLAHMGIGLAFQEQRSDTRLQGFNLSSLGESGLGGKRRQLGYIALDTVGKLNPELGSGFFAHDLSNLNAEIGKRLSAVLRTLGSTASNSLGRQGFDFVVGAPILHRRDLATHLAHLRFQVAQHLEKLSGLRPWQERHWEQNTPAVRCIRQSLRSRQAMCLLTS